MSLPHSIPPTFLFEESTAMQAGAVATTTHTVPALPPAHFLSLARNANARYFSEQTADSSVFDTSTVAAADFDVDARSGFMPPSAPISRLTGAQELWENLLDAALGDGKGLKLGELEQAPEDRAKSEQWRSRVRQSPVVSITPIRHAEVLLRRAHLVLTYVLHLYIHSQPPVTTPLPESPFSIPVSISVPLIELSTELSLPPILTYSDTVLYNWALKDPRGPVSPDNIRMVSNLSLTTSEEHFYVVSARIELRGVEALEIMRSSLDEAFIGDTLALRRIANYLQRLSFVIDDLSGLLLSVRDGCDPNVFYQEIRPWFRGWSTGGREWLFEGVDEAVAQKYARMSGPSAGQSSLIHALDIFLGVDHTKPAVQGAEPAFHTRMEQYMPRHHRAFLQYLRTHSHTTIRGMMSDRVGEAEGVVESLRAAYDGAVMSMKKLRDGHIRVATLYIVNQARRQAAVPSAGENAVLEMKGTGGTSLVPFLKECRDNTLRATVGPQDRKN